MRRVHLALAMCVAGCGVLVLGCGGDNPGPRYDHVGFDNPSKPPLAVQFAPHQIKIPEGIAIAVTPTAIGTDGAPLRGEVRHVSLSAGDSTIADFLPGPDDGTYVLIGVHVGTGSLVVHLEGIQMESIPVIVTPQS